MRSFHWIRKRTHYYMELKFTEAHCYCWPLSAAGWTIFATTSSSAAHQSTAQYTGAHSTPPGTDVSSRANKEYQNVSRSTVGVDPPTMSVGRWGLTYNLYFIIMGSNLTSIAHHRWGHLLTSQQVSNSEMSTGPTVNCPRVRWNCWWNSSTFRRRKYWMSTSGSSPLPRERSL